MYINRELKRYCLGEEMSSWCHTMEVNKLFLQRMRDQDHPDGDAQGAVVLNSQLIPDGLHPNADGYDRWGALLAERVQKIIMEQQPHKR